MHRIQILKPGLWPASTGLVDINEDVINDVLETYNPSFYSAPLSVTHENGHMGDRLVPMFSEAAKVVLNPRGFAYGRPDRLEIRPDGGVDALFDKISKPFIKWAASGNLLSVSPGLYQPDDAGNPYPGKWALQHVAALGDEPPAQKGMDPLTSGLQLSALSGGVQVYHKASLSLSQQLAIARRSAARSLSEPGVSRGFPQDIAIALKEARRTAAKTLCA